jgi:hypothetical protein
MIVFILSLIPYILAVLWLAERIAKWIPDDATGFFGAVRKICKTISVYTENK